MSAAPLPLSSFEYDLPDGRIAQTPARPRDGSRLMLLGRAHGDPEHHRFGELPELLEPGDLLVVNRTRVMPARLRVERPTGGKVELLLVAPIGGPVHEACEWLAMARPGKALDPGKRVVCPDGSELVSVAREAELVRLGAVAGTALWPLLAAHGEMPVPPYIERPAGGADADREDYQTMFANQLGAVAAPTAALHFTPELVARLGECGVGIAMLVLHVGPGTFVPIRPEHRDDIRGHRMHGEWYDVPKPAAARVREARADGRRVIAVGTTSLRALESWWATGAASGVSELFVYPGYDFCVVDGLITNFHLPRSTLLMLVAALCGRERLFDAYATAIRAGYRFYSYGDAMLIV